VGAAGVTPVSRALLYRHFFAFQNYLDRMADSEQKSGKDGSALRHYNQKKLEFSDAQFGHVRAAAQGLEALLKVQDAKAARVIQAERARFPHGKLTREADLPPASAELKALQAERDSIIESAVATLKAAPRPPSRRQVGYLPLARLRAQLEGSFCADARRRKALSECTGVPTGGAAMKGLRLVMRAVLLTAALLVASQCPVIAQQVVGVSAILDATNSSTIYTYSATELDYVASEYYDAAVEGYLFQNGSQIRWGYASSGSASNIAYGYLNAPVSVGSDYQLESDHYLMAAYMVEYNGSYYYSNPYYYPLMPSGGSGSSSSSYPSGGGDAYIEVQYIYLGTTAIGISTAPPYIGGIREWANGGTYGVRGTSGYIEVYGQHLLDVFNGGTTPAMSGNGVSVSVYWASANQVNLSYTIASSASAGDHTLTLSTRFGTSNGATFTVADPTPQITSITPDSWDAGQVVNFVVSGSGFGSNPSISVSGTGIGSSGITSSSDTQISAWVDLTYANAGTATVTVTSNGYGGSNFVPAPQGGTQNQTMGTASVRSYIVSQSPSSLNVSTGDTNKTITTTVSGLATSFTPAFSWGMQSNLNSSCNATLGFSSNSGGGSVNTTVTASPAGCSGVFNAVSVVGPRTSSGSTQIVIPPQILIRFMVGEAGGQTGDMSQLAIASSAKNRFGDSNFPGGSTATYQAVIIPGQYYGASDGTTNGHEPELTNAVSIFTGTTGDIVGGAKCYWSPTAAQWSVVQQALAGGATQFPANTGAPGCWDGQPRQIVRKTSIGANNRGGAYAGAPAFLFLRESSAGSVVVVEIP